jgi:hypothetical protein
MRTILNNAKIVIIAFVGLVVLVMAVLVFQNVMNRTRNTTAVVKQIRALNRWETSSFTIEKIIDQGNTGNIFQKFLFGDRILLIAHGEVIGGFDLSELDDQDVKVKGNSIEINLPAPRILSTTLNESETRVYDRQKGLLVPSNDNLESDARVSAVAAIHQAACSEGILTVTSENAKKQLISILSTFQFSDIKVTIPKGSC